jgi:MYXO-CTERM domain-containing protein
LAQLETLGLSTDVPVIVTQTNFYVIRLGVTTADFTTTTGDIIDTLPEFNGTYLAGPPFPGGLLVGDFFIPDNATGLTISGTFGNSTVSNSAPSNVCFGPGGCGSTAVPETSTWGMMVLGFMGLGLAAYRGSRRRFAPVV